MKKALVLGGDGFIGSHLVTSLKEEGFWVKAADLKKNLRIQTPMQINS